MRNTFAALCAMICLGGCELVDGILTIVFTTFETSDALQGEWIGPNGVTITVTGDVNKALFSEEGPNIKANTYEGGASAMGEVIRYNGPNIAGQYDVRGRITDDKTRINWDDGQVWFRPPNDLDGITKGIAYPADSYTRIEIGAEIGEVPAECRRLCRADERCGAFSTAYPASTSTPAQCRLYDRTTPLLGRYTSPEAGAYSGAFADRLSPMETGQPYVLRSAWTGRALDMASRTDRHGTVDRAMDVVQTVMSADNLPAWTFELVALDTYTIRHVGTGRYLAANPDEKTPGSAYAVVYPESVSAADAQRFKVTASGRSPSGLPKVRISPLLDNGRWVLSLTNDPKPFRAGKETELSTGMGRSTEWEFVAHGEAALFVEEDVKIDVLNQVAGPVYPAEGNFYLWYNNAPQAQFKGVAEMNFTQLIWDNVPFRDAISAVANFVLPDEVLDVVPSLERKTFTVPARAENVEVRATFSFPGLPGEDPIGTVRYGDLSRKKTFCVNVTGVASPSGKTTDISDDCTRWGASTIKTYNQTGETVYVMWTDEINWSLANIGTGLVSGLLVNNTQNVNSSFYRYFAVANAWGIELPDESYDAFQAFSICQKPNEVTPILSHSVFDMAQNAFDIASLGRGKPKSGQANNRNLGKDVQQVGGFVSEQAGGLNEQSDEYKQTYRQYNPILAVADYAGGETKTIMAVNASLTTYWFIDSAIDENWIIRDDGIVLAEENNPVRAVPGGRSSPAQALAPALRKTSKLQDCITRRDLVRGAVEAATN